MKIVVLDGFTLSPLAVGEQSEEHPSWSALAEFGALFVHERTSAADLLARCEGAGVVLTNKVLLSGETLLALPDLRYIGVMATGTNVVDLTTAEKMGVAVTNVPNYSTESVVQMVFALLLELVAKTGETSSLVRKGAWSRCPDFCFTVTPYRELADKTLGIYGFGTIGSRVAAVAHAFGMRVLAFARTPKSTATPVHWVSAEELLRSSDVISLHCPLTPETQGLIGEKTLPMLKPGALLINTGRGPLLDEAAVTSALHSGHLGGLGADVLSKEPPEDDNPLLTAPNTIVTPHIAWASIEARHRLMAQLVENLSAFLAGISRNRVV